MIKNRVKKVILMVLFWVGVYCVPQAVQAEDYSYLVSTAPCIYDISGLEDGKATITWTSYQLADDSVILSYDVEVSNNKTFSNSEQYSTNSNTLTLNKSVFGKNGGRFYVRVRIVVNVPDEATSLVSDWSETKEMVFVKINKTNFPGMYKVLKNGGKRLNFTSGSVEKLIYEKNKDGWLDPAEIQEIYLIGTTDVTQKVNGVYKTTKATSISSFKGVEYFPNLYSIKVQRFSGKKADLSKCSATFVELGRVTSTQLTVIAPNAKHVSVEYPLKKLTKVDLSKCNNAVEIYACGDVAIKTLKLPKNKKNLKILTVSRIGTKSLDLNAYTKLQQLYIYQCDVKNVKVNKCKNLRYIYFYQCNKIKSLNLKANKKLRGADFYQCSGLTKTTVKKSKSGKYTWNKGKWWYETSAYKKDMKKLYQ